MSVMLIDVSSYVAWSLALVWFHTVSLQALRQQQYQLTLLTIYILKRKKFTTACKDDYKQKYHSTKTAK